MSTSAGATVFDFVATSIEGAEIPLGRYRNNVLLIVNVASRCGYTPQYQGLEALYRQHREQGLVVLGFPCNQFGRQEPGSAADIQSFCSATYDVTFPLFSKVDVNGPHTHPLFAHLKSQKRGWLGRSAVAWNFTKFLVDRDGVVIGRYGPTDTPAAIEPAVIQALSGHAGSHRS